MNKDNLDILFTDLENDFDIENPRLGHQQRFLDKLNQDNHRVSTRFRLQKIWKPMIGIAASLIFISFVFIKTQQGHEMRALASVSPEMAETESFFATTIENELERLNGDISPEYQDLVVDALFQIELLEQNYQELKIDLNESGDDKRVIAAMISNYQSRIELLQNVLEQIDTIKQELNIQNEDNNTF